MTACRPPRGGREGPGAGRPSEGFPGEVEHERTGAGIRRDPFDETEARRERENGQDERRADDGNDLLDALLTRPRGLDMGRDGRAAGRTTPPGLAHEGRSAGWTIYLKANRHPRDCTGCRPSGKGSRRCRLGSAREAFASIS